VRAKEAAVEIRLYPEPVLRERARPVERFDEALADLARAMARAMVENHGLGLAAPQVGVLERLIIVSPDGQEGHEMVFVNPEILQTDGWQEGEEGCLSFPGIFVKVGRFDRVRVRYQDLAGLPSEMEAEGLLARAVQHEMDHLDGRLLVDRMTPVQRMAQRRRLRELVDRHERRAKEAVRVGDESPDEAPPAPQDSY
jgi:peptide deformylase